MKMRKYMISILLSVLAVLFLPIRVLAAGSIDLTRDVGLTISYQDGNMSLAGAQFDIYLVATVDEFSELTPTEPFSQFNVNIRGPNDDAWRTLASTLEGFVLRDNIIPTDSGETDQHGQISFPNQAEYLKHGLYLILGHRHSQDGHLYEAAPFMALLPTQDKETNTWVYDVTAMPKYDSSPEPDTPDDTITRKVLKVWADEGHASQRPSDVTIQLLRDSEVYDTVTLNSANNWRYTWTELDGRYQWTVVEKELENYTVSVTREGVTFVITNTYSEEIPDEPTQPPNKPETPDKPTLPQTGQIWWPVPVLAAGGLLLIVLGLLRRRGAGYEA